MEALTSTVTVVVWKQLLTGIVPIILSAGLGYVIGRDMEIKRWESRWESSYKALRLVIDQIQPDWRDRATLVLEDDHKDKRDVAH